MLVNDAVGTLIPSEPARLRVQAQRAFAHSEMKRICEQFTKTTNSFDHLLSDSMEIELQKVARAFVDLQLERHAADYDLAESFDRQRVLRIIDKTRSTMSEWKKVRRKPNANVFLTALLLGSRWNR
jgi:hypothetical protein